jgi:glycosyltransferase involved in cell wall biosynthesis
VRMLIFAHKVKKLKLDVRATKLQEYLQKNGIKIIHFNDFNYRNLNLVMLANYFKLMFCLLSKKRDDIVLFENERSVRLLKFFKKFGFKLALDIIDNRALQHSAYQLGDDLETLDAIQKVLLSNIEICDYIFVVSQECKELYPKKYHSKIFIIENASDPMLFKFTNLPNNPAVGFISGIALGRGVELLIQAMQLVREEVRDAKLSIAGASQEQTIQYYAELKEKFESDWIQFHDDIYYSINAPRFFNECYLTVIPHPDHVHYQTTLPVKLFDSLSCGRPVVATNCKETAKILQSHNCGLVADFTATDLAEKIIQLLLDRKMALRMGTNGRKIVEQIYNWDVMAKKIIDVVSESDE